MGILIGIAVVAAVAAAGAIAALFSAKKSHVADVARLTQELAAVREEKVLRETDILALNGKLEAAEARAVAAEEKGKELEGKIEELLAKIKELSTAAERAKQEATSQRQFFSRKAREAFENLRQRLAADGFPERIEVLAEKGPQALSDEAKRLLKELESWTEQSGLEDPNIFHTLAIIDFARGDGKRAELRLRAASRISSDPLLLENLGDLMRLTGRAKRAAEFYKNAAKTAKDTSPVQRKLGLALFAVSEFAAAVKPLTLALATNPKDLDLNLKTARALIESGDFQRAVDLTHTAAKRFSKAPELPACAVVAFGKMKRFGDAQRSFEKAIEIDPKNPDAHVARGFAYFEEGKPAEAVSCFEKALEADANRADALYGLGVAANHAQSYEEALKDLKRAVELKPDYAEAWYAMKTTYEALKQFESAVEALNKAVALNPSLAA